MNAPPVASCALCAHGWKCADQPAAGCRSAASFGLPGRPGTLWCGVCAGQHPGAADMLGSSWYAEGGVQA